MLKFSERSAISAVPATSTLVPYSPCATARVESASWVIGRESRRAKSKPEEQRAGETHRAPEDRVPDHAVHRGERQVRSRSTSTPQGGSPTGEIDASTLPDGVDLRAREARREADEVGHQGRRMLGRLAPGRRRKEDPAAAGPRASRGLPAGPRPGTRLTMGAHDTSASTTPIRWPFSSTTGVASTATVPISGTPQRLAGVRTPSRADSKPFRNSKSISGEWRSGPTKLPWPIQVHGPEGDQGVLPLEHSAQNLGLPRSSRRDPCPSAAPASRMASPALVSCCAAAP